MMASPSELSLECKPHSYSLLLKSFGEQTDPNPTQKLEEFLSRLEEERLKIDAFKRELPLCMQLLTNAVETSRQQLQSYRANSNQGTRPVLEEFIPLKHSNSEGSESATNMSDKANWMTSAQLWSQASEGTNKQEASIITSPKESEIRYGASPKLGLDNKHRNGGAFLPFSKDRISNSSCPSPTLALTAANSSDKDIDDEKKGLLEIDQSRRLEVSGKCGGNGGALMVEQAPKGNSTLVDSQSNANSTTAAATGAATATQPHRKARRCWSPDLHRRFVNALQMLGGSQVATPKQIRELMKVDGLTNDEVKSHLQKYRLHTRRPSPSPQAAAAAAPQLVVLGGIWVPPEYATAAAAAHGGGPATATLYSTHPTTHAHTSPHYCAAAPVVHQEFYPAAAPPPPPSQQAHHHQLHHHPHPLHLHHVYKPPPSSQLTHSSPESDGRGSGDRSESIEDGKSDSSSWKAESGGDNGGERKRLVMRDEGEESNGSEITLKF